MIHLEKRFLNDGERVPTKMAPQPKLTVVNKVPNIPSVLLGLT